MNWNQYQAWVDTKARYIPGLTDRTYCDALGLAGEAGEFADKLKKLHYHSKPITSEDMAKELGDVLYYVARLAGHLGFSLQQVVEMNVEKLNARYPNGFDPDRAHSPGETPAEEQTPLLPEKPAAFSGEKSDGVRELMLEDDEAPYGPASPGGYPGML